MIANAAAMSKPAAWLLAACDCVGLMQVVPAEDLNPRPTVYKTAALPLS